jgi:hypothetical protein
MVTAGYQHEGDQGIPGREAFTLPPDAVHYHHLYSGCRRQQTHRDHILLRDHLRTNAGDRERYAVRKRELAYLLTTDRSAYVDGKAALVEELIVELVIRNQSTARVVPPPELGSRRQSPGRRPRRARRRQGREGEVENGDTTVDPPRLEDRAVLRRPRALLRPVAAPGTRVGLTLRARRSRSTTTRSMSSRPVRRTSPEEHLLEDRAQRAGAVRRRRARSAIASTASGVNSRSTPSMAEELAVLLDQRVARLGEDADERVAIEPGDGRHDREPADELGDQAELHQIFRHDLRSSRLLYRRTETDSSAGSGGTISSSSRRRRADDEQAPASCRAG